LRNFSKNIDANSSYGLKIVRTVIDSDDKKTTPGLLYTQLNFTQGIILLCTKAQCKNHSPNSKLYYHDNPLFIV
jgi:hypothetical protein